MNKKILLIDDEEIVVKSMSKLLGKEGYDVFVCRSGEEAVEKVRSDTPDLIVCDMRMPKMSGVEVIRTIRGMLQSTKRRAVPEILITGYAEEDMSKEAEALQVADYIYKPFDIRDFLSCVKKNVGD